LPDNDEDDVGIRYRGSIPMNFRTAIRGRSAAFGESPRRQSGEIDASIPRRRRRRRRDKGDIAIDCAVSTGILAMEGKQSNI